MYKILETTEQGEELTHTFTAKEKETLENLTHNYDLDNRLVKAWFGGVIQRRFGDPRHEFSVFSIQDPTEIQG